MQYRFGTSLVDTARFELYRDGKKVDLEPQVLKFLIYLIENRDRVVPRDELLDKLFGRRIVTDNAVTVRIRAARKAVGDTAIAQSIIATIQGKGYRFVASIETSAVLSLRESAAHAGAEAWTPSDAPGSSASLISAQPAIAVLPFQVMGGGEDEATIARGLTHDVITHVARSRTMLVIARGTAFQYSSGVHDVGEVGAKLGVRYVCQGAVQISAGRIRISVGLAETASRQEIWSRQYERRLIDVLAVQAEIAVAIVGELDYEVQRHEMLSSAMMPATRLDSWSAYHRGLSHMYAFRMRECDAAEKFFRQAIDLEPGMARAYAGLSFVNYERAYLNLDDNRTNSLRRSTDLARQALDLNPRDPMGHWALSRARFLEGDLEAARTSISLAAELNPSYANAQYFYGWVSMQLGEHSLCLERIDLARRLSPNDPLVYGMLGISAMSLALLGRSADAITRAAEALVHPGVHYQALAMGVAIYALSGDVALAQELLRRVRSVRPGYSVKEFFSVYQFRRADDIDAIKRALRASGLT